MPTPQRTLRQVAQDDTCDAASLPLRHELRYLRHNLRLCVCAPTTRIGWGVHLRTKRPFGKRKRARRGRNANKCHVGRNECGLACEREEGPREDVQGLVEAGLKGPETNDTRPMPTLRERRACKTGPCGTGVPSGARGVCLTRRHSDGVLNAGSCVAKLRAARALKLITRHPLPKTALHPVRRCFCTCPTKPALHDVWVTTA